MTAAAAPSTRPARSPGRTAPHRVRVAPPVLRLVPQRRSHAARTPYILVVVGLLIVGLLGLLALNTLLAEGSFRVHSLQTEGNSLSQQEQALREQVSSMQSPSNLQAQALAQGMVPGGPPLFLRLEDGAVLGQPSPAKAPPAPAQAPVIPQPAAAGTGR